MNHRFITVITAVVLLLGTSALPAAVTTKVGSGQSSAQTRLQRFKQALTQINLTPAQQKQIQKIWVAAKANAGTAGTGKKGNPNVLAMQKNVALLSPAQKAQLTQIMKSGRK